VRARAVGADDERLFDVGRLGTTGDERAEVGLRMRVRLIVGTKNFWGCVAAHAITNLMLGIYVVTQGKWRLW
jgi:hypothetical protein